jgi:hypothetical protein
MFFACLFESDRWLQVACGVGMIPSEAEELNCEDAVQ